MNKELIDLLKKGTIDTDADFDLFYKYSDDVITGNYTDRVITDVRLYLLEEEGVFCEIYADIVHNYDESYVGNIKETQNIRYFIGGEEKRSFSDVQEYLRERVFSLFDVKDLLWRELFYYEENNQW